MKKLSICILLAAFFAPQFSIAAEMQISGWVPYWKASDGVKDARKHLDVLTELNPFTLSITTEGKVKDLGNMKKSTWTRLFKDARKQGVTVIPTIMWSDTKNIHEVLSDPEKREDHVDNIVAFVKKGKYDGIDIDYEGKRAETKEHFSAFLTELKKKLGSKTLACTIEARTPSRDLYGSDGPVAYAVNDFKVIGKVCDQVRIMTYDQQRADITLNESKSGAPYIPVADIDWVKKVAQLTSETIPKNKIMLGVATYGREWELTVSPNRFGPYVNQWSVTHDYAMDFADEMNIEPLRNNAKELSFTYFPDKSPYEKLTAKYKVPKGTPQAYEAAQKALAYANATGNSVIVNVVWWSDAEAIKSKLELAQSLGLRGISVFKVDGTEDEELWRHLLEVR